MISTESYLLPSSSPSSPTFILNLSCLSGSYLLWVGVSSSSNDVRPTTVNLGRDLAVGMPLSGKQAVATPIFRSSAASDVGLQMASRLARRFSSQIFLSLDLPPALISSSSSISSQAGSSTNSQILLDMELQIGSVLKAKQAEGTDEKAATAGVSLEAQVLEDDSEEAGNARHRTPSLTDS